MIEARKPLATVPVFYREELVADAQSFSPSAGKPKPVVADWIAAGLPVELRSFPPVTRADLALAHEPEYVDGILSGRRRNGFGNTLPEVTATFPFTTGAMLAAAREAIASQVACAPVSGFHHADRQSPGGYCTFNGLMVTALRLMADRKVQRILILDCDYHYGDGTDRILEACAERDAIKHETFGRDYSEPSQAEDYLKHLERVMADLGSFDLVLYQAGADVHVDDPLGGVLTSNQMRERDRLVFEAAAALGVPVAWNLAGGYQDPLEKVIVLHRQTMEECSRAFDRVPA